MLADAREKEKKNNGGKCGGRSPLFKRNKPTRCATDIFICTRPEYVCANRANYRVSTRFEPSQYIFLSSSSSLFLFLSFSHRIQRQSSKVVPFVCVIILLSLRKLEKNNSLYFSSIRSPFSLVRSFVAAVFSSPSLRYFCTKFALRTKGQTQFSIGRELYLDNALEYFFGRPFTFAPFDLFLVD